MFIYILNKQKRKIKRFTLYLIEQNVKIKIVKCEITQAIK